jgi:hypothetical protein
VVTPAAIPYLLWSNFFGKKLKRYVCSFVTEP